MSAALGLALTLVGGLLFGWGIGDLPKASWPLAVAAAGLCIGGVLYLGRLLV